MDVKTDVCQKDAQIVSTNSLLDTPATTKEYRQEYLGLPCPPIEREDWMHVCLQFAFKGWRHPYANLEPTGNILALIQSLVEEQLNILLQTSDYLHLGDKMDQLRNTMEKVGTLVALTHPPKEDKLDYKNRKLYVPKVFRVWPMRYGRN